MARFPFSRLVSFAGKKLLKD